MSLTFTTADAVLKEDYKDPLREQLNNTCFILSQIEENTDDVVGLRAYLALHTSRSDGVGARGEGGTLPTANNQGYSEAHLPIRYNYGRIQVSGPIIKAMSKDRGSFIRAVRSETEGIRKDLKRDVNRQCWGTSNGVIATCGTTSTDTTIVLLNATRTQVRQLWNQGGMAVEIGTVADPDVVAGQRTTDTPVYTSGSESIDISGANVSTTSGTHFIFRESSGGASDGSGLSGDGQFELTGLQSIVATGDTLFGVAGATVTEWNSYVDSNATNRSLTEQMVNKANQRAEISSDEQVDLMVGSDGVSRFAASLLESIRRNIDNVDLKAGYEGIRWSTPMEGMRDAKQRALVWDQDCPNNQLFGLCTDRLVQFVSSDWDWMDEDGAVLSRVANQDAYEATMFKYHELASGQRNAHWLISNLTEA